MQAGRLQGPAVLGQLDDPPVWTVSQVVRLLCLQKTTLKSRKDGKGRICFYLGDVVASVVGADNVLTVLVVTPTFHLNITIAIIQIEISRILTRCFWILERVIW